MSKIKFHLNKIETFIMDDVLERFPKCIVIAQN